MSETMFDGIRASGQEYANVIEYAPPGPVGQAFLDSTAFVSGICGPLGSGKSVLCCMRILENAAAQAPGPDGIRRSRYAVIRNTYAELKTTTIKTWHQWVPKIGAGIRWVDQPPQVHHIKTRELDMEVLFLALDNEADLKKLLSLELTGAWINEAREMPVAVLNALRGRIGRYPSARDGGCTAPMIAMDTNPPDTDHWWYKMAVERNFGDTDADPVEVDRLFSFFHQPGGRSPQAENLENLPKRYYENQVLGNDELWIRVHVDAEYGYLRDGKPVYHEYRDHVHVSAETLKPWPGLPLIVGVDFGLTPASAVCQRGSRGHWRVLGEIVSTDMGAIRFGQFCRSEIAQRWPGMEVRAWGDPAGNQRAQTDEQTAIDLFQKNSGILTQPAPTNTFTTRRESVANALSRFVDGEPGMLLDPSCKMLRKGFVSHYRYKRVQIVGGDRYHDAPDKNEFSHVHDALQYAFLGGGEAREIRRPRHDQVVQRFAAGLDYDPFSIGG